MADKSYVSVKCIVKDVFDQDLKPRLINEAGLTKAMTETITDAINNKSSGKLTTKEKRTEGFLLTATLTSLQADDENNPTKLDAKAAISVITIGSTAKSFEGTKNGSIARLNPGKAQSVAENLVSKVFEAFMPKIIETMLSL